MVSDDECGLLGSIPGAWISEDSELDLGLSLPHFTTPCPPPASFLLNSPVRRSSVPPPVRSPPPRSPAHSVPSNSSMSNLDKVVLFHRRLSRSLFSSQELASPSARRAPKTSKVTQQQEESTPQTLPSLLDSSSVETTPSPSRISGDLPPILPPLRFHTSIQQDDVLSLSSRVTRLSFGPPFPPDSQFDSISSGSVLGPGWDFSSPVYQRAQLPHSVSSSDSSVIDPFPSSASLKPIPSIPSISSELQLNNLPILSPSIPLFEPHPYSYFTAGDMPMSSFFETLPVVSTTPSMDSIAESFIPSASQAHQDMLTAPNQPASGRLARVIVRDQSHMTGDTRRGSGGDTWSYTCQTLPYEAGLRPHAYVDNSGRSLSGKRSFGARRGNEGTTGGIPERLSNAEVENKRPSKLKKLIRGSSISRLLDRHAGRKKTGHAITVEKENLPVPTSSSPKGHHFTPAGHRRHVTPTSPDPGSDETCTAKASPLTTPKPNVRSSKRFSLPRRLSLFVVPKPRVTLVESPTKDAFPEDFRLPDERLEVLRSARPNAGFDVETAGDVPAVAYQVASPAKKDIDAKSKRRKSWFSLASPTIKPALRRFSR